MNAHRSRSVLQAHATRSFTALNLLLHGRDRSPRDLRSPLAALVAGAMLALAIVVVVVVGGRIALLLQHQS